MQSDITQALNLLTGTLSSVMGVSSKEGIKLDMRLFCVMRVYELYSENLRISGM